MDDPVNICDCPASPRHNRPYRLLLENRASVYPCPRPRVMQMQGLYAKASLQAHSHPIVGVRVSSSPFSWPFVTFPSCVFPETQLVRRRSAVSASPVTRDVSVCLRGPRRGDGSGRRCVTRRIEAPSVYGGLLLPRCENNGRRKVFPEYRLVRCQSLQNMRKCAGSNLALLGRSNLTSFSALCTKKPAHEDDLRALLDVVTKHAELLELPALKD
jgi:hypothetical protein